MRKRQMKQRSQKQSARYEENSLKQPLIPLSYVPIKKDLFI